MALVMAVYVVIFPSKQMAHRYMLTPDVFSIDNDPSDGDDTLTKLPLWIAVIASLPLDSEFMIHRPWTLRLLPELIKRILDIPLTLKVLLSLLDI